MKAMILNKTSLIENNPLEMVEIAEPHPKAGEILIRVKVCGICRTDLHIVEGEITPTIMPVIPGHQIVGVVEMAGEGVKRFKKGDRVGVPWLHKTCGVCKYCRRGDENLCENALFTGFSVNGGYAMYAVAHEDFSYPIPDDFPDIQAAPLLCAGIIGYRALRLSEVKKGERLGLYGFGASAHIAIQVALHWGCEVYAFTKSDEHKELARKMGAVWVGNVEDISPKMMHRAIIFAPAGEIIPIALEKLEKGGTLALAGIYMTQIPPMNYEKHLFYEKKIRSVTASTRKDAEELLSYASEIPIRTNVETFPLEDANKALQTLKDSRIRGSGALTISL